MISALKSKLLGSYKIAVKSGMQGGKDISVMGNVSFGAKPYLITLEDEVHHWCREKTTYSSGYKMLRRVL